MSTSFYVGTYLLHIIPEKKDWYSIKEAVWQYNVGNTKHRSKNFYYLNLCHDKQFLYRLSMPGTSNMHSHRQGSCENIFQDEVTEERLYTARIPAKLHLLLLVTTVRNRMPFEIMDNKNGFWKFTIIQAQKFHIQTLQIWPALPRFLFLNCII